MQRVCFFAHPNAFRSLTHALLLFLLSLFSRGPNLDFRKQFRLLYDSSATRKLRFNVYGIPADKKQMDDEDRIGSTMLTLKEIAEGAGIEFVFRLSHEQGSKQAALTKSQATISVTCVSRGEMTLDIKQPASPSNADSAGK